MTREQFEEVIYEAYENNIPASLAEHKIESLKNLPGLVWQNVKDEAWVLFREMHACGVEALTEKDAGFWLGANEDLWLFSDEDANDDADADDVHLEEAAAMYRQAYKEI